MKTSTLIGLTAGALVNGQSSLVQEIVLTTSANQLTIPGLDGNLDKGYLLEFWIPSDGVAKAVQLACNGDLTVANYKTEFLQAYSSTQSAGASSTPYVGYMTTAGSAFGVIDISVTGNVFRALSRVNSEDTPGVKALYQGSISYNNTITNLVSLTLLASAGVFPAGTIVRLYRKYVKRDISSPFINQGNLVERKVLITDTAAVTFTGLNSLVDGDYCLELALCNAASAIAGAIQLYVNGDTNNANYTTRYIDSQSGTNTTGTFATPRVAYLEGNPSKSISTIKITVLNGVVFFNTQYGLFGTATPNSLETLFTQYSQTGVTISSLTITGTSMGTGSAFSLYRINGSQNLVSSELISLAGRTTDYPLKTGETVYLDYTNATTVPLNIATQEGEYELTLQGDSSIAISNDTSITLSPNNTNLHTDNFSIFGSLMRPTLNGLYPISKLKSLVPAMLSNTTPDGTVSSSSAYNASFEAYNAFDISLVSKWHPTATTGYIQVKLKAPAVVDRYTITGSETPSQSPNAWTLQGSNNGTDFTAIDTRTAQTFTATQTKSYTATNVTAYLYYRINVTAANGSSPMGIVNIGLFGTSAIILGSGLLIKGKLNICTATKGKTLTTKTVTNTAANTPEINDTTFTWHDTTTPWTSLGTLIFPFAQSGKVAVKRIL